MPSNTAYIGIGANLGNAAENVLGAIDQIARIPSSELAAHSSLYRTAPVDADGDDYINAVVKVKTDLAPETLFAELQKIERIFGRQRPYRNAPRTLDLDLLLYNSDIIRTPDLVIPHPRMDLRAFVLVPLTEIAPDIRIPGKDPVPALLSRIKDQAIRRI